MNVLQLKCSVITILAPTVKAAIRAQRSCAYRAILSISRTATFSRHDANISTCVYHRAAQNSLYKSFFWVHGCCSRFWPTKLLILVLFISAGSFTPVVSPRQPPSFSGKPPSFPFYFHSIMGNKLVTDLSKLQPSSLILIDHIPFLCWKCDHSSIHLAPRPWSRTLFEPLY